MEKNVTIKNMMSPLVPGSPQNIIVRQQLGRDRTQSH